jgi:dTMP kinase
MRRPFIVLEGIDGSGTTSQVSALAQALRARGHRVVETREPSDGPVGRLLRERLDVRQEALAPEVLALLFAADRLDHVQREVEPALAAGAVVLSDRYILSSWAYQGLSCDPTWLRALNARAPWPDSTLLLRVPAEVALERVRARRAATGAATERFDDPALQHRLAQAYDGFLAEIGLPGVVGIDGTSSPESVTGALLEHCVALGL